MRNEAAFVKTLKKTTKGKKERKKEKRSFTDYTMIILIQGLGSIVPLICIYL